MVRDTGEGGYLPRHQFLRGCRRRFDPLPHRGIKLADLEAPAGLDADLPHAREDWLVGGVRRVKSQQLGRVCKEPVGRHRIDDRLRRRLDVDARVDRCLDWLRRLSPLG